MPSKPPSFLATPEGLNQLNAAKARLKLTHAAIVEQAGVSADTVRRLWHPERGKGVSEGSLVSIARALGLEPGAIVPADAWQNRGSMSEAKRRIQEALTTGATKLDLSGLQLTEVPPELGQLSHVTALDLSQNQLTSVPPELGQLSNLTMLDLYQNQLTSVPPELGQLSNLTELYLDQNQLTSVPPELGQLSTLTVLYLTQNRLTSVPPELGQLSKLAALGLAQNQLTSVPPELGQLSNLTVLDLYQNQLTSVPPELGQLSSLKELYLHQNQLTSVPLELGQLSNLGKLSLHQNRLTSVPPELDQLINLTVLCLDQNQLTSVPEFIAKLVSLERIDLNDNALKALPEFLGFLPKLKALLLHGNEHLGISAEILGPTDQEVNNGAVPAKPQEILDYYFRVRGGDRTPLNEAKLILVGFGAVGKTSLVNRLIHNQFDPQSQKTEGIQITPWDVCLNDTETVKLHVWDFGGQEIMHSTHQFFLTERSLYVLVLNGRQGHEDTDAEYWLELIQSFGGNSPVLVVLNKVGEHPFDVNRRELMQKYPGIREFIPTDCKTEMGLEQLRTAILRETDRLENLRDPFPASWVTIKNRLSSMTANYIPFETYRDICQQDGETDAGAQNSLAVYLHNLGIALNYKNDPRLRDTHVLNPHWVTNGIYKLLNAHDLATTEGEFDIAHLCHLLNPTDYPTERHGFLMELMRKFELCFPFHDEEGRYLIPDLLDKQQPPDAETFDLAQCLNFRYEYPILPEGILPRFIVRTHVLSREACRWRTGVILHFEGNRALVKADRTDRAVTISVDGPLASRRRLLAIIRYDFDRIHSSFKFKPLEKVPVPQHPTVTVDYKELLTREKHKQVNFDVFTGDTLLTLNVRDLLNGVDLDGGRHGMGGGDRLHRTLRLFYSYAEKDEPLRDHLDTHLKLLQRNKLIQMWHDRRILPGSEYQQEIDNNLAQADIILLLISPDFIASDYCYDIEMARALERHDAGNATVIPILLRPVDWETTPFRKLQPLPSDRRPVTLWPNPDQAWLDVEQGIKQVAQKRINRL